MSRLALTPCGVAGSVRRSSSLTLRDPKVQIAAGVNGSHATSCERSHTLASLLPRQPAAHQVADQRREGVVRAEAALDHRQQRALSSATKQSAFSTRKRANDAWSSAAGATGGWRRAPGHRPSRTTCASRSHTDRRRSCSTRGRGALAAGEPGTRERLPDARLVDALSSHTIGARPLVSSKAPHATSAAYLGGAGSLTRDSRRRRARRARRALFSKRPVSAELRKSSSLSSASGSPRKLALARLSARVTPGR